MKVIFKLLDFVALDSQLEQIANHYNSSVKLQDIGHGKFIFVKSRIKIVEKTKNNEKFIHVWGAKQEDIVYLSQFWGEPLKVLELKMSPIEFASELADLPNADELNREDIMTLFGVTERDIVKYSRTLRMASRRPSATEDVKKANNILEKLT
ncbi:MAG: hypothetical protein ACXABK_03250 [Candidatus Heimdallarchaeaceae archaeon]|jgi:hypothetical protein